MIVVFLVVVLVTVFLMHRARKRATMAGLNSERPVFHVDPPSRRLGSWKHERL